MEMVPVRATITLTATKQVAKEKGLAQMQMGLLATVLLTTITRMDARLRQIAEMKLATILAYGML